MRVDPSDPSCDIYRAQVRRRMHVLAYRCMYAHTQMYQGPVTGAYMNATKYSEMNAYTLTCVHCV